MFQCVDLTEAHACVLYKPGSPQSQEVSEEDHKRY